MKLRQFFRYFASFKYLQDKYYQQIEPMKFNAGWNELIYNRNSNGPRNKFWEISILITFKSDVYFMYLHKK